MYFHTDSQRTITWLANVMQHANAEGHRVRLAVGGDGSLKVKVGEGVWSPPIAGTPDPYRDTKYGACQSHTDVHPFSDDCVGFVRVV